MDRGKLEQLKAAGGVEWFSTSIDTNRTLMDGNHDESLYAAIAGIGDVLGSDVRVDLTISLTNAENTQSRRERFRASIVENLDRLIPPASAKKSASAKVFSKDGYAEELELVEHRMQVSFEVAPANSERARYTELVNQLAAASENIVDVVKASI